MLFADKDNEKCRQCKEFNVFSTVCIKKDRNDVAFHLITRNSNHIADVHLLLSAFVAPLLSEATGAFRAATGVAAAPQRGANPSFATECPGGGSQKEKAAITLLEDHDRFFAIHISLLFQCSHNLLIITLRAPYIVVHAAVPRTNGLLYVILRVIP